MKYCFKNKIRENGFTFIELIASMVIFALMFTIAGMGIVLAAKGYVLTRENAHMAQKAQLALSRLDRELREMTVMVASDNTQPYLIYDLVTQRNALARDGDTLKLFSDLGTQTTLPVSGSGDILVDVVKNLSFTFYKGLDPWVFGTDSAADLTTVKIDLELGRIDSEVGNIRFTTTVRPRNLSSQ